jgi:hypothetical protein
MIDLDVLMIKIDGMFLFYIKHKLTTYKCKRFVDCCTSLFKKKLYIYIYKGLSCCDRMVVGFTTTCAISAYHHVSFEFESCL